MSAPRGVTVSPDQRAVLEEAARSFPYPIAVACHRYLDESPSDPWRAWELLSRDVLQAVLQTVSHVLLADLVSLGEKPAGLYHWIQGILSRPTAGQFVGFLRETARHYRSRGLSSSVPDLLAFLLASEVDATLLPDGKALLGVLVDYRNSWAHGRATSRDAALETAARVLDLTCRALGELRPLASIELCTGDGASLTGAKPDGLTRPGTGLVAVTAGPVELLPLVVQLKDGEFVLLEEHEPSRGALAYRGPAGYVRFGKKELREGDPKLLLDALKELLRKVRSIDAVLPAPGWEDFSERAAMVSDRTEAESIHARRYDPALFVPRAEWEGEGGLLTRFLTCGASLLALTGAQGAGKSALAAHLARSCRQAGHSVLFLNGQRLTYADVAWSENPIPGWLRSVLGYENGFTPADLRKLAASAPPDTGLVVVLDAVNEVDGTKRRWNPFRALESVLEWACAAAHPSLKVIVTFRLDLYEEFDALEEGWLPADLAGTAFAGNLERYPWIHHLSPFGVDEARGLYEKLQALPERQMRPAMSWDDLVRSLGSRAERFLGNPLLFTILLRAYNGATHLDSTGEEELLLRYASQLTGAVEVAARPFWARALGFLRDANVTRKERVLVDILRRMGREGSAAFLLDRLDSSNARDRRILSFLSDPDDRDYKDLVESGLVVVETIELPRRREAPRTGTAVTEGVTTSRLTFFAELMAVSLEGVAERVLRLKAFKNSLFAVVLFAACAAAATGVAFRSIGAAVYRAEAMARREAQLLAPQGITLEASPVAAFVAETRAVARLTATNVGPPFAVVFAVMIAFYAIYPLLQRRTEPGPRELGLLLWGTSAERLNESLRLVAIVAGTATVLACALTLALYAATPNPGGPGSAAVVISPIAGAVLFLLGLLLPRQFARILELSSASLPPRVLRRLSGRLVEFARSARVRAVARRNALMATLIGLGCLPVALAVLLRPLPRLAEPGTAFSLYMLGSVRRLHRLPLTIGLGAFDSMPLVILVMVFAGYVAMALGVPSLAARAQERFLEILSPLPRRNRTWPLVARGAFVVVGIAAASVGFAKASSALAHLTATPEDVRHLGSDKEAGSRQRLTLLSPGASLAELPEGFRSAFPRLRIEGACTTLERVGEAFPGLVELSIDAHALPACWRLDAPLWRNTVIELRSDGPPALPWLPDDLFRTILRLTAPVTRDTANLDCFERVAMPGNGLDPRLLARAHRLRWLLLWIEKPQEAAWFDAIQSFVLEQPGLERFTLCTGGWDRPGIGDSCPVDGSRVEAFGSLERIRTGGSEGARTFTATWRRDGPGASPDGHVEGGTTR